MTDIRKARLSDRDRLSRLWSSFLEEQGNLDARLRPSTDASDRFAADLPEWIHDTTRIFDVALVDGEIVGFASARLWSLPPIFDTVPELFIEYLYVDRDYRRNGIGRALVDRAAQVATDWGAHRIRLAVADGNRDALAFWEVMGGTTASREIVIGLEPTVTERPPHPIGFGGNT